ncbi:hypothetical protein [Aquimarina sp. MMG016]|uniref:hypothetical protein n=1 Tax=Aquimarina sp. MMG016 TaxID=2822690 RepID=UPI001B39FB21|nr:hypothetical protein [Aquimarina sp. MMG016]MBQ4821221.1 hypothetical protein [Aquimarina sp. MMG016]
MKKFKLVQSLILIILTLAFTSCSSDDDNGPVPPTVRDIPLTISKGFTETLGQDINAFDVDVSLASSGITYNTTTDEFEGTGTILILDFHSSTSTLAEGTYTYEDYTETRGPLKFDGDVESTDGESFSIEAGTVTVSAVGQETKIEYDLILDSDTAAQSNDAITKGSFQGELVVIQ